MSGRRESCLRCHFADLAARRCHANAPTHEGYPLIEPDTDWCGEFHPSPSFQAFEKAERLRREREEDALADAAQDVMHKPMPARPVKAVGGRG